MACPAYERLLRYFGWEYLPARLQSVSAPFDVLVRQILPVVPDNHAEVTVGLRKLLEAKDCFERAVRDLPLEKDE
jgi:hypothetical protein